MKNRNHHYQNSPNVTFSVGENIAKFLEEECCEKNLSKSELCRILLNIGVNEYLQNKISDLQNKIEEMRNLKLRFTNISK